MQCTGTVLGSEGEIARVLIESEACDQCKACGFGAVRDKKTMEVRALNTVGAEKDDRVTLELSGRKVMSASAILFLIPFLGFIAGFLLGYYGLWYLFGEGARTLVSLLLAFAFLGLSYYLVHVLGERYREFDFVIQSVTSGREPGIPFERPPRE